MRRFINGLFAFKFLPQLINKINHPPIINYLLNITTAGQNFPTGNDIGRLSHGKIISLNAGAKVNGAQNRFFLKTLFIRRHQGSAVYKCPRSLNSADIFKNLIDSKDLFKTAP